MRTIQRRLAAASLAGVWVAALGLLATGCGSSGTPGSSKTVTVTATPPPVTRTAAASPSPSTPGLAPCLTSHLRLTVGAANGAAGTIYYPLVFTNSATSACTMYGYPGIAFVSSPRGHIIGAPAGREVIAGITPTLITIQPGGTAHAILAVSDVLLSNQCHSHQVPVHTIQAYPPDQYTALFAPFSGTGCTLKSLVVTHVSAVASGS